MAETLTAGRKGGGRGRQGSAATDIAISDWFVREILPFEAILTNYLRRNWKNASDVADLRQEVYVRTFDAAKDHIPDNAKRFLFMTARNLLIDLVRREQVVPMEFVADFEAFDTASDAAGPERETAARSELRRLQEALDRLPPRAREAIVLTYIEDLRVREIAARMGVARSTVSTHVANGLRALVNMLHGDLKDSGGKS
jgi:RNA polymerase sigma factor (sigma-70 family)